MLQVKLAWKLCFHPNKWRETPFKVHTEAQRLSPSERLSAAQALPQSFDCCVFKHRRTAWPQKDGCGIQPPGKSGSSWEGWIRLPCFPFSFALFSGKILTGIMMGISYLLSNLTLKFGLCKTQKRIGNSIRASHHSMYSLFLGDRARAVEPVPGSQSQIRPPWLGHLLPATSTRGSSEHVSASQANRKMQTRRGRGDAEKLPNALQSLSQTLMSLRFFRTFTVGFNYSWRL